MARESAGQKATIDRVMREFKDGDLESSSGETVTDRKQAIAIGLSEAGASSRATPDRNKRNRARTEAAEAKADKTRTELYAEAKRRDIPGRSRMTKAELARALS